MRTFDTGATRDSDTDKPDYIGFLSPLALERFGQYMHKHRIQKDGSRRPSNNWKKGIPKDAYVQSAMRHFLEVWMIHEGYRDGDIEDALCALWFNAQGYLHEHLKEKLQNDSYIARADARGSIDEPVRGHPAAEAVKEMERVEAEVRRRIG